MSGEQEHYCSECGYEWEDFESRGNCPNCRRISGTPRAEDREYDQLDAKAAAFEEREYQRLVAKIAPPRPCPFCGAPVEGKFNDMIEHPDRIGGEKVCPLNGRVFFGFARWNRRMPSIQAQADHEGLLQCRALLNVRDGDNLYDAIKRLLTRVMTYVKRPNRRNMERRDNYPNPISR